ncbi:MAG: hypothetical protein HC812_13130 [Leptolyngbya sp. RL_3_1]|nr:hypothetical protein [Leptolyngbya sp. RL_3_1]
MPTWGEPITLNGADLFQIDLADWQVAIASPGVQLDGADEVRSLQLSDSQALLLQPA